jgi:hypothetical protein
MDTQGSLGTPFPNRTAKLQEEIRRHPRLRSMEYNLQLRDLSENFRKLIHRRRFSQATDLTAGSSCLPDQVGYSECQRRLS